ncbi:MAG: glycosyltransferase family 4 protein [Alphaproteobacteria bacterium]|nr:glycosyltransferase family 4 protein [Alphaproteobacteria bacterium]
MSTDRPLRILHCFRSPVGGIFRHVRDLAEQHHRAGHKVGILCDSTTGGSYEDALFDTITPFLDLGLTRTPIRRAIGPADIATIVRCSGEIKSLQPDIIHGHGAKGGALARVIGSRLRVSGSRVARFYTPHGGSLHFSRSNPAGRFFFALERLFERMTDGLIFVSEYEESQYNMKVGTPRPPTFLIYNGLGDTEFEPVPNQPDAADFLYIGMMRRLKGPDIFIEAFIRAERLVGRPLSAVMIGDGDEKPSYEQTIVQSGLQRRITIHAAMPAREAFGRGAVMVVPSRAESMPYIVLEALAAGRPLIASRVGGIPEILGTDNPALIEPDNADALATAMAAAISDPESLNSAMPSRSDLKSRFSAATMADAMIKTYVACLDQL